MKIAMLIAVVALGSVNAIYGLGGARQKPVGAESVCGPMAGGLQLCGTSRISAKLGRELLLDLVLVNRSKRTLVVPTAGGFDQLYSVTITDPSGNRLRSRYEALQQKIANRTATDRELVESLPIGGGPHSMELATELAPNGELKSRYDLNRFYDFTMKGKYRIEIKRKLIRPNGNGVSELSLKAPVELLIE